MAASAIPDASDSLLEAAVKILCTADPWLKARYTNQVVDLWRSGSMPVYPPAGRPCPVAPDRPARGDDKVKVTTPGLAPKRGKGGSLASRQALLHSLCHIENWAVDLSWDVIARFGNRPDYELPREFFDDFVTVAEDECRHFLMLEARLKDLGSYYGAMPVHDGLWESASHTSYSLPARLAVESCVHEARGLDVLPATIAKFRNNGDEPTAQLLEGVVYPEEVNHCKAGVRWFRHLYELAHRKHGPAAAAFSAAPPAMGNGSSACANSLEAPGEAAPCQASTCEVTGGLAALAEADTLASRLETTGLNTAAPHVADAASAAPISGVDSTHAADMGSDAGAAPAASETGCSDAAAGQQVDTWIQDALKFDTVQAWFHHVVGHHFWGSLKPPFNDEARAKAGFDESWYVPLVAVTARRAAAQAARTASHT